MNINDIVKKEDNSNKKRLMELLNIPEKESLRAEEINAIIDAIKNMNIPLLTGDPLDEYISHRNE